jgi:CBS domain containing-hemolysin-like protein
MIKVRATRIQQMAEQGNKRAAVAWPVVSRLSDYLPATQLGVTLSSLALGWIGEPAVSDLLQVPLGALGRLSPALASPFFVHTVAIVVGFTVVTTLHIVLGELVPKTMAIARAESVALWCAPALQRFYRIFRIPIWLLNAIASTTLRWLGFPPTAQTEAAHSGEELRMLVSASARTGQLDETERVLLDNVFEFSERVAREIMVPRSEMLCLFIEDPFEESLAAALDAGFTRFPVCRDDKDNILGMVHLWDLMGCARTDGNLQRVMRPIIGVPETISVSRLLKEFQRQRTQIAIVVDEYGGTAGLITMEDLIEEIVGEIQDEFDEEEPEVTPIGPGAFELDGAMLVEEVEDELGFRIGETEGIDTIGGYLFSTLGTRPQVGQTVTVGGHVLEVAEVEGFRITRVRVQPGALPQQQPPAQEQRRPLQ